MTLHEQNKTNLREIEVQPSLIDRLWDDLPGLNFEIEAMHRKLVDELGSEIVNACLDGGQRVIADEVTLSNEQKRDLASLYLQTTQKRELEAHGIILTPEDLLESVRRDIEALFNTVRLNALPQLSDKERGSVNLSSIDLSDFENVQSSVLNYGMPSFAGSSISNLDFDKKAMEIKEILLAFEPRLQPSSVQVELGRAKGAGLIVTISGVLLMAPFPEQLRLRTSIDLNDGSANTALES